ncbi:hypothetical protein D9615_000893 [Tricholomella constricta]|uniref:Uncharacterized protein n=1 Tax=Tricholomella constricta TaxID=117010 RepID=A0A8H5HLC2_9AGAR|nr:hypothetical protein D9615_000893 [Tricholomella constricta]
MSYTNPLHPPVYPTQRSGYSALGDALKGHPETSQFLSPSRRRLPQAAWAPSAKWKLMTGRTNQIHGAITFDYIGYAKQGVPMRELSTRSTHALASMITGANDQVLAHTGLTKITLRILWPGYESFEWTRVIEIDARGPVTRAQLGAVISQNFARFIERARSESATSSEWHLGANGIRFEHLVLLSLRNVFDNAWQADVAIDLR